MAEASLKNKTVRGVGWSAIDAFLGQGVTFIVGLVLARLLSPDEYGLIGIVTIFTTILAGFVDCGFANSLIRKPKVTEEDYNTMFIVNMVMSFALCGVLYLCAPAIARFFDREQLVILVRVMGALLIFQALAIVQNTNLGRKIDFKTKAKASVVAAIASGVFGIVMALMGCGVWSLVVQQLSRQLINSVCLWFLNRWWPSWKFSKETLKYMWGFGWKLMFSGLIDRIWAQLYHTVVGKFYSPATLGQYSRSKEYASLFSSNFTAIVSRVSFPVLSQVQEDKARMISAYRRIIKTTMFVTAIALVFMAAVAEPLVYCLIGPQWHQAATFLPFICLTLSLYPLHSINLNMLQVQGRTDIFLVLEIIKKILAIVPLSLGIFVDIYWMLIGSFLFGFVYMFLNTYHTGKKLGYTTWMQMKDIAPSYGVGLLIAVSVFFIKYLPLSYFIILPIQLVVGGGVFFVVCETLKLPEYLEVKGVALDYLGKLKRKR